MTPFSRNKIHFHLAEKIFFFLEKNNPPLPKFSVPVELKVIIALNMKV